MTMIKLGLLSTSICAACLFLAACGGGGGDSSASSQATSVQSTGAAGTSSGDSVSIKDFAYSPPALTVAKGTAVTFTNQDSTNHTATSTGQDAFDTGTIGHGQTKSVTLETPGTFSYVCSFHPFMHGSITVRP
jgi:plastocyanin